MRKLLSFTILIFSIIQFISAQSVVVNPDGSHSIGISHGITSVVINQDGTHSIGINHGNTIIVVTPNGTQSNGINFDKIPGNNPGSTIEKVNNTNGILQQDDLLFSTVSYTGEEEISKLKILMLRKIIRLKEYRSLKDQCLEISSQTTLNKANEIYSLYKQYALNEISSELFLR